MKYEKDFNGKSVPFIRKFQIGENFSANAGLPVEVSALSDLDGVMMAETTSVADCLGVSMDVPATRLTAQQTGNVDPAVQVSVVCNPGGLFRARLAGSATSGATLTTFTNTLLSTTGLLVTAAPGTAYESLSSFPCAGTRSS